MKYIEAPQEYDGDRPALFLAGGITDAVNWQTQVVEALSHIDITVLNPRRKHFPMDDPVEGERQIEWEYRHLQRADLVAFWFPPQTLCPIALFELGACCAVGKPLVVGTDPNYARRFDVLVQLRLRRFELDVLDSLADVTRAIIDHPAIKGA